MLFVIVLSKPGGFWRANAWVDTKSTAVHSRVLSSPLARPSDLVTWPHHCLVDGINRYYITVDLGKFCCLHCYIYCVLDLSLVMCCFLERLILTIVSLSIRNGLVRVYRYRL